MTWFQTAQAQRGKKGERNREEERQANSLGQARPPFSRSLACTHPPLTSLAAQQCRRGGGARAASGGARSTPDHSGAGGGEEGGGAALPP
jgi:hypothetical protein